MLVRTLCCAVLLTAFGAGTAAAQTPQGATQTSTSQAAQDQKDQKIFLQGDTTPRPALPTVLGDTGLWFVSTAETLPKKKSSFSLFRANYDRAQGLTDVNQFGLTAAHGLTDHLELFASWNVTRLHRDVTPVFVPSDIFYGGVSNIFPFDNERWSKTLGGPLTVGGKYNFISQSRGAPMAVALRGALQFPVGPKEASNDEVNGRLDVIASREFRKSLELTGTFGAILRQNPPGIGLSDSAPWGVGASFPSRSPLRGIVEWTGEFNKRDYVQLRGIAPIFATDGSVAPILSRTFDTADFKAGLVYQMKSGAFIHGGLNYSAGTGDRVVAGIPINHNPWGFDVSLGFSQGVTPARVWATNYPPSLRPTCSPSCTVMTGQTITLNAGSSDQEHDQVTVTWTAPSTGTLSTTSGETTTFTAPRLADNAPAQTVVVTLSATDNQTGPGRPVSASTTITITSRTVIPEPINRPPAFQPSGNGGAIGIDCTPCVVRPGGQQRLTVRATDPENDAITYQWGSAPLGATATGSFSSTTATDTVFTAPADPKQRYRFLITVTARDAKGATSATSVVLQVEPMMLPVIYFDFAKWELDPTRRPNNLTAAVRNARELLDLAADMLKANPDVKVQVQGNTDQIGGARPNVRLGRERAQAVHDYLVAKGVPESQFQPPAAISFGKRDASAARPRLSEPAKSIYRRVDIVACGTDAEHMCVASDPNPPPPPRRPAARRRR